MTEYQDKKATKELGVSSWSFVGYELDKTEEDAEYSIYQTDNGDLFATAINSEDVRLEVYEEDGEFLVY